MTPPGRWAGAAPTATPTANHVTRQDLRQDNGQGKLTFDTDQRRLTTSERAVRFHEANPAVYALLARLARQWVAETGGRKLGIGALVERVRWEVSLTTTDPHFKINNSYRPWYARELMRREADLRGLFETRTAEADEADERVQP